MSTGTGLARPELAGRAQPLELPAALGRDVVEDPEIAVDVVAAGGAKRERGPLDPGHRILGAPVAPHRPLSLARAHGRGEWVGRGRGGGAVFVEELELHVGERRSRGQPTLRRQHLLCAGVEGQHHAARAEEQDPLIERLGQAVEEHAGGVVRIAWLGGAGRQAQVDDLFGGPGQPFARRRRSELGRGPKPFDRGQRGDREPAAVIAERQRAETAEAPFGAQLDE